VVVGKFRPPLLIGCVLTSFWLPRSVSSFRRRTLRATYHQ
jgi:hypothetical protein